MMGKAISGHAPKDELITIADAIDSPLTDDLWKAAYMPDSKQMNR